MQESYFVSCVMGELNLYTRLLHTGSIGPSVCYSEKLKHSSLLYLTNSDSGRDWCSKNTNFVYS